MWLLFDITNNCILDCRAGICRRVFGTVDIEIHAPDLLLCDRVIFVVTIVVQPPATYEYRMSQVLVDTLGTFPFSRCADEGLDKVIPGPANDVNAHPH